MGIEWGPTEQGVRVGIEWLGWGWVDKDTDAINLRANIWLSVAWPSWIGTSNSSWSGYTSGSATGDLNVGGPGVNWSGEKVIRTISQWVDLDYGSTKEVALHYSGSNIVIVNDGTVSVSSWITLPARPFQYPNPPKNVAVTKNSDTSHTVSWTGDFTNPAGGYPWSNVIVLRWDNVTDDWYRIATLNWSATSYTDTTTRADRRYHYGVYSVNSTGDSTHVNVLNSYTTPSAHTNLQWAKTTSDVVLTWTKASTLAVATEVYESAGGGAWTLKATIAAGTNTWTHVSPNPAVTHKYRVRPVIAGVYGAYTESTIVQLLAAPLAPTALSPSGITVDPNDGALTVTWTHNAVDGTSQTAYEYRVKESGGAYTSSGKITSSASTRAVTGLARGKTYIHQVRTYGQHADASPWSTEESFTTGARPQTSISYPTATPHGTSSLTLKWTYYDLESAAHTASRVELLQGSTVVHTATLGAVLEYLIPASVSNSTTYKARAQVQDASGLWSPWDEQDFTTDFIPPTTPTVTGSFNADLGSVTLTIVNPAPDGILTIDPVSNSIYRSVDGGPEELIAEDVPLNTAVTDWVPSSAGMNTYRVVAWSATPTSASSTPLDVSGNSSWLFVNGGAGHATMAKLKGGPAVQMAVGRVKVLHQFVGYTSPVEFTGSPRTRAYALSGSVDGFGAEDSLWGSWEAWEAIADLPAPLIYRDPLGRREYVSISDVSISHDAGTKKAKVSATLTVVHHG